MNYPTTAHNMIELANNLLKIKKSMRNKNTVKVIALMWRSANKTPSTKNTTVLFKWDFHSTQRNRNLRELHTNCKLCSILFEFDIICWAVSCSAQLHQPTQNNKNAVLDTPRCPRCRTSVCLAQKSVPKASAAYEPHFFSFSPFLSFSSLFFRLIVLF